MLSEKKQTLGTLEEIDAIQTTEELVAILERAIKQVDPQSAPEVFEIAKGMPIDAKHKFYTEVFNTLDDYFKVYVERPIGPKEFVESPYYLNRADELWPLAMEVFCEINGGEYDVAVLTGGIGVGKTTLSIFTQAYQLYLLACLVSPQRYYGQIETDEIVVVFQSITKSLAASVDYARFTELIRSSPWFKERFPPRGDLKSELHFPKRVIVKPVSGEATAAIGQNVIGGLIDEVNFMQVTENSKQSRGSDGGKYDQAERLWNAIARRRESRFMLKGNRYPGVFCLLSSKQYPGEFTDRLAAQARKELEEKGVTRTYVYDRTAWNVRPDKFKDSEWFNVFVGDDSRKPYIMPPGEVLHGDDAALVHPIPEEYRTTFETSLLDALRDVAGISTQALHPFMPNINRISEAFSERFPSLLSTEWCDFVDNHLALYKDKIFRPDEPRFVHIDLAVSNDSAGIACGFVDRFVEIKRGETEVETLPVIRFDYCLEVKPPRNGEISFEKIRELLYKQREFGMHMKWATLDTYQSTDTIQLLRQRGWVTGAQSVDTDNKPYNYLKSAIMDGRIEAPLHARAKKELAQLEWNALKRTIDHPPTGSKDVSDCMAGVVFGLTQRNEIWSRHKVLPRKPARLIAEARNKNDVIAKI